MKKIIPAVIFLFFLLLSAPLFAETIEQPQDKTSKILDINEEHDFIIVNIGKADGVHIGDILEVNRDGEAIGRLKALKIRDNLAAAEIVEVVPGKVINAGDLIKFIGAEEKALEEKKAKGEGITKTSAEAVELKKKTRLKNLGIIVIDIDSGAEKVWFYLIQSLKEQGFIITNYNKATGNLTARKNLEFSLVGGIWADMKSATDYEAVLWAEAVSKEKNKTVLSFKLNGSYEKGGKRRQFKIKRNSKIYREVKSIGDKVKEEAQYQSR